MRLANRTAVVTGGARGLGRAIVQRFVDEGARVAVWDVSRSPGEEHPSILELVVDITDAAAVSEAAERTRAELGPIDILVNNAGIAMPRDPWDVDEGSWGQILDVNLSGAFWCIQACMPDMIAAGYGKVVNVSSIAALNPRPHTHPAYAASKAGLLGLVATLTRSLGPYGICVNAVVPGLILTEIHESYTQEQIEALLADVPLSRRGVPTDVANAVLYLSSPESDYVSGTFINVNGGATVG